MSKNYVAKDFSGKMYTLSVLAVVRLNYTESVPENNVKDIVLSKRGPVKT